MAQKADFIRVPPAESGLPQTMPTDPEKRLPSSEILITRASVEDLPKIVEGLYTSFPHQFWDKMEPLHLRPPTEATRYDRMVRRLRPTFSNPNVHWMLAKHIPTGEMMGCAGWTAPGNPVFNYFSKSAVDYYGWRDQYDCTDEEFEELWSGVDMEKWDIQFVKDDAMRKDLFGDEPHWYLAPLFTLPQWQGRGVGKLLLQWAIDQADATDPITPLYLESAPTARAVYMHCGFKPQSGPSNFMRRGPAIVRGLEAAEEQGDLKGAKIDVEAVAAETEADLAN